MTKVEELADIAEAFAQQFALIDHKLHLKSEMQKISYDDLVYLVSNYLVARTAVLDKHECYFCQNADKGFKDTFGRRWHKTSDTKAILCNLEKNEYETT